MTSLSVVIPIKDERDNLKPLHERLRAALDPLLGRTDAAGLSGYELLFVDDGSGDGTFAVLEQLAADDPRVKVLRLRRNYGQTPALRAGIDYSQGDVIVTMDGDLQNDPADIPMLLEKLTEGYDAVLGEREKRQDAYLHPQAAEQVGQLADPQGDRHEDPRHGLHAAGHAPRRGRVAAAVRRNAPLHFRCWPRARAPGCCKCRSAIIRASPARPSTT